MGDCIGCEARKAEVEFLRVLIKELIPKPLESQRAAESPPSPGYIVRPDGVVEYQNQVMIENPYEDD